MSVNIWNLEWLNHNSQRSYPIADWATKECSDSAAIKLPDDFILALSLGINSAHSIDIDGFYIKSVLVMDTGCSVVIGYGGSDVAITHIRAGSDQMTYTLTGLGDFSDIVGYIAINPDSSIMKGVSGYYNFSREATCLEPDCIRPMIKTISSVSVYTDAFSQGETFYGDIVFRAGANMDIRVSKENNNSVIVFSAVNGADLTDECECTVDKDRIPIRSINGEVTTDENGDIQITGTDCLNVRNGEHSITLEDTCSQPCCGCAELDALYDNIKDIITGATTLRTAIENVAAKQDQVELVYQSEGTNSCNCKSNS